MARRFGWGACCCTSCGALGQKQTSITQATSNYANRIDLSCRRSGRSYCFQPPVPRYSPRRRSDFCGHSAVAVGLTPPGTTRYRYRGAYNFRIRSLVHPAIQCGPFDKPSMNDSFILCLAFMISAAVLSLTLSTDVAVRNRTRESVKTARLGNRSVMASRSSSRLWWLV